MRRREFIRLMGATAGWPLSAWGQQSSPPLVGVLNAASAKSTASSYEAFRAALRQLGYIEERNIHFDYVTPTVFLIASQPWRRSWSGSIRESSCRGPSPQASRCVRPPL